MERIKEFKEPDLVYLTQGLVSLSTARTYHSDKVSGLFTKNKPQITKSQVLPKPNVSTMILNIFYAEEPVGQMVVEISTTEASISYWVDSSYANRGIATNAVILITDHLLHQYPIEAYVLEENTASIRVLEKAGFQRMESLYIALTLEGTPKEHLVYRIEY
jgi:ribosomal protein S18 acetylase RimI-like enzyme